MTATRLLIPAIAAGALLVAGCGGSGSKTAPPPGAGGAYGGGAAKAAANAAPAVTYASFTADPKSITVKVGQKVTWTNTDSAAHNVTSTGGPAADKIASGAIDQGATFSFSPKAAGTISYVCTFHPQMTGYTVVVTK